MHKKSRFALFSRKVEFRFQLDLIYKNSFYQYFNLHKFAFLIFISLYGLLPASFDFSCAKSSKFCFKATFVRSYETSSIIKLYFASEKFVFGKIIGRT